MSRRRLFAIGALTLAPTFAGGTAFAQAPPPGHEQHHPAGESPPAPAPGQGATPPAPRAPAAPPPSPAPPASSATKAPVMDMSQMMREMERMMGGPIKKPLMSRLLDVSGLSEAERAELRRDADMGVQQGLDLLDRGTRELAVARRGGDAAAIARALSVLSEGSESWQTGSAVQRALALPPSAASNTALRWFRAQMNLEIPPVLTGWPWGLSPIHLAIMAMLALTAGGGLLLYLYKVRRSLALLARLTRGPQS